MLDSALARAKHLNADSEMNPDIAALAAAYAFGIALNNPFIDGNKRTSVVVCETFLPLNRYDLVATDESVYKIFLGVAAGKVTEDILTQWIREHLNQ